MNIKTLEHKVEVPRDGRGKPWVVPPEGGLPIGLQRTTTFVDVLEDKTNIANWKARSVLAGSVQAKCAEKVEEAKGLDPTGTKEEKDKLNRLVEEIMDLSGANDKRNRGTYLHGLTELVDAGLPLPESVTQDDRERLEAYATESAMFTMKHTEEFCVIPELGVGGTPDRVGEYVGPGPLGNWYDSEESGNLIIDVKTGNIEYGILKMCGQLGVYSKARLYDHTKYPIAPALHARTGKPLVDPDGKKAFAKWKQMEHEPVEGAYTSMGNINTEWGVIVHLPSSGRVECTLHWINLSVGWEVAEEAVRIREMRRRASAPGVMIPFFGAEALELGVPDEG